MNKIVVLVVEDTQEDAEILTEALEDAGYELAGIASSPEAAEVLLKEKQPDIAILDIYLGKTPGGIAFATSLNQNTEINIPHIFLTSASDKATFTIAKSTRPSGYLIKPFNPIELDYAIELAIENFAGAGGEIAEGRAAIINDFFYVKKARSLIKLAVQSISHVKVEGRYCELYVNDIRYVCRKSLNDLVSTFPTRFFFRPHRNYMVNREYVQEVTPSESTIYLTNGTAIPIGTSQMDMVKSVFPHLG